MHRIPGGVKRKVRDESRPVKTTDSVSTSLETIGFRDPTYDSNQGTDGFTEYLEELNQTRKSKLQGTRGAKAEKKKARAPEVPLGRKEKRAAYLERLKQNSKKAAAFGYSSRKLQKARVVTWNCDSMRERRRTTAHYLKSRNIQVCLVQETKEDVFVHVNSGEYTYISTAGKRTQASGISGGVGAWIHHSCKIHNYEEVHRNILKVDVEVGGDTTTVSSAYGPQERRRDEEKFWPTFKTMVEGLQNTKRVLIGVDANGRLGKNATSDFNEVGPGAIHDATTANGNKMLKAVEGLGYRVLNTLFKPKPGMPSHTYECAGARGMTIKSQIDFLIGKGFGVGRTGWSVRHCQTDPYLTMNKPSRTHLPVSALLRRIHVHTNTQPPRAEGYAKKLVALAINEEAEDARNAPQEWGQREVLEPEEGETTPETDENAEAEEAALKIEYRKELLEKIAEMGKPKPIGSRSEPQKPDETRRDPHQQRLRRRVHLIVYREETKRIHEENPEDDWEQQAEKVAQLAAVCFPIIKERTRTWHGVPISERTARKHDLLCYAEENLVRVITDSPREDAVFLRIQNLKEDIVNLKNKYEESADEDVQQFYLDRARELEKGSTQERDNKTWHLVQTILKKQKTVNKRKTTHIQGNNDKKCWTPKDKAAAFGEFISDNFTEEQAHKDTDSWWGTTSETQKTSLPDKPHKNSISKKTWDILNDGITIPLIEKAIEIQARNKSDGPDKLAVELFQADAKYWARRLFKVFSNPAELHQLEDGRVAYIFKNKGETYQRTFYRPISVLNAAYKIWASAQTLLMAHVVDDVMSISQAGFRMAHGTRDSLCWNQNVINRVQEKFLSMGYLDLSKAFDRAIRKKIWTRLLRIGCPKAFVAQLRDGHINSHLRPSFEGAIGDKIHVSKGVYQGSPLSPVLFIIYSQAFNLAFEEECEALGLKTVAELSGTPGYPNSQKPWEKVYDVELEFLSDHDKKLRFTAYADDTVLMVSSVEDLKKAILAFERSCDQFGMEVNRDKTEIQTREKLTGLEKTALNQGFLKAKPGVNCVKDNVRLLGAFVNINGYTKPAVTYRLNLARKIWRSLRKPFFQVEKIKMRTRLLVYQALVVSTMMFGMEAFDLSNTDLTALQSFQNVCLRDIYDTESLHIQKHVFGEEVTVPDNVTIQKACQIPSVATRYRWMTVNFATSWVRKANLSTLINKFKFVGELDNPKQAIKGQARGKQINLDEIIKELADRYNTYRRIIIDDHRKTNGEDGWDFDAALLHLKEEGFCNHEKICTLFPGEKMWDPAVIGADFLVANQAFKEEWIKTLDVRIWRGLQRLLLDPRAGKEVIPDDLITKCEYCNEEFRGREGLSTHLSKSDKMAKLADPNCVTCLDQYAKNTRPVQRAGPLIFGGTIRVQQRNARFRELICPWGFATCTPGKANGWWCIVCRRALNATTPCIQKKIQQQADQTEVKRLHLKTTNQEVIPHTKLPVKLSCTNSKKPASCKFPDKTKIWCAHCRKVTGFTPKANTDKNEAKKLAKQAAKQRLGLVGDGGQGANQPQAPN